MMLKGTLFGLKPILKNENVLRPVYLCKGVSSKKSGKIIDIEANVQKLIKQDSKMLLKKPLLSQRIVNSLKSFATKKSDKFDADVKKFMKSKSKSLLKKHLTQKVYDSLKTKKTKKFKATLRDCIQSGVANPDSNVGIYAPDGESYRVFAPLFDPIINEYHGGFKPEDCHPPTAYGRISDFVDLDPECKYVRSTRVRTGRSIVGYPFNPCLTIDQYCELEQKVFAAFMQFPVELKGEYLALDGMKKEKQKELIDQHFLFKEGDRFLQAAQASRFWPVGRGIYLNIHKTFLVWVNEEDHLRIISMQNGGNLGEVYRRMVRGVRALEECLEFSRDKRLGYLSFCPTNLGTALRASVHIKLPKLGADLKKLEKAADKFNLQVRGTRGEHTESEGGFYDISNRRRLGLTECEAVLEMQEGIRALIALEKAASTKKSKKGKDKCK